MAELIPHEALAHTKRRKRAWRPVTTDMTPMVDLAFLLLTFFMLTTRLSEPTSLRIVYPKESGTTLANHENCTTLLVAEAGKTGVYHGLWKGPEEMVMLEGKDLRKELLKVSDRSNNGTMHAASEKKRVVLIKSFERTQYRDVIDVVDELNISGIARYVIQDMSESEIQAIRQLTKNNI